MGQKLVTTGLKISHKNIQKTFIDIRHYTQTMIFSDWNYFSPLQLLYTDNLTWTMQKPKAVFVMNDNYYMRKIAHSDFIFIRVIFVWYFTPYKQVTSCISLSQRWSNIRFLILHWYPIFQKILISDFSNTHTQRYRYFR